MIIELEIYEPKTVEFDIDKMHQMVLESCRKEVQRWDQLSKDSHLAFLIDEAYDNIDYYLEKQGIEADFEDITLDYIQDKYEEYLENPDVEIR